MPLRLGEKAPNFDAQTTEGDINFYDWAGDHWVVLYSHPSDYTPVCTTELGRTAALKESFEQRHAKVIALSVDSLESHMGWVKDIEETQNVTMNFPIIADHDKKIAEAYDMMHPAADDKFTVRSVFIIDPQRKVRLTLTYPPSTGRNFQEILRVLDSLQLTDNYSVATPVDWNDGEDVVVSPSIKTEDIPDKFPKGHKVIKPYLRTTPQPNR
ncbi:alkyl hydroperoxide reductase subunit AhpC [Neolewinella xylanilytica]|uniref:Alkyl hydroperoxide reductase subunit AhpC n=1 Tax=Neolewinella xylanilytica TaxID=1514080 RepID=A0A2S6IBH3_9BACT|nr:peroxiredoxin [Neolewinella xylanilytica]PPK88816.1 alkyl hydroperoxide reductase subunit AhpC [Neolewinella xylanilytica]